MYSLGIDVGTSGIRAVLMDKQHCILAQAQVALPQSQPHYSKQSLIIGYSQKPDDWWNTLGSVITQLSQTLQNKHQLKLDIITHLAIDGTSGTVLLCNHCGDPVTDALMYNDQRAVVQADQIKKIAPENTAAMGSTSGLAKILWLYNDHNKHFPLKNKSQTVHYALNQADWLCGRLMEQYGLSDHNNALKMGYDAQAECWPEWLWTIFEEYQIPLSVLPKVALPGQVIGKISPVMAAKFGFNETLKICAGTTDSTAAIIASGAKEIGDAVTSMGSSLVMKVIAQQAIFDQTSGVYSQPYGQLWLVGGSSNSGGEVLKQFFQDEELQALTQILDNKIKQGMFSMLDLNYYPLSAPGERFPIHDPNLKPHLTPRPTQPSDFFQALLEGMSDIETMAYQKLVDLGAPYPKLIRSIGGGSSNKSWAYIRKQKLGIEITTAKMEQAAAGSALLAQTTW